jgi:hypothetical protein
MEDRFVHRATKHGYQLTKDYQDENADGDDDDDDDEDEDEDEEGEEEDQDPVDSKETAGQKAAPEKTKVIAIPPEYSIPPVVDCDRCIRLGLQCLLKPANIKTNKTTACWWCHYRKRRGCRYATPKPKKSKRNLDPSGEGKKPATASKASNGKPAVNARLIASPPTPDAEYTEKETSELTLELP